MTSVQVVRLARFCRECAGDHLRSVTAYDADPAASDGDGITSVYLRDDLQAVYTAEGFADLVAAARSVHPVLAGLPADAPVGPYRATVHTFDGAVVLQFAYAPEEGCLVSFDRAVGDDLASFVSTCLDLLA